MEQHNLTLLEFTELTVGWAGMRKVGCVVELAMLVTRGREEGLGNFKLS
jgi:hypothetical protein